MTDNLSREAEERFGIKADPDDIEKLRAHLLNAYGGADQEIIDKVFSSGEAAGFLTVNETYFFREPAHFSFLWDILPSFERTGIRICCAAVASGCEAYSAAMMIEAYNRGAMMPLSYYIDAFDINHGVIETAREGVYGTRVLREDGSCFRYMADPYLNKLENGYRVEPSLKKNICFFIHNLMDKLPPKEYDIIFFRNAFIYFSHRNRGRILLNLSRILREGGILLLGVSETAGAHNACSDARLEEKNKKDVFYFQKKALYTETKLYNKIELVSS
jgi:chemotaxis protein methyltransferase CheR